MGSRVIGGSDPDVVVIGGGPAGSSVAGLIKKYSPHSRVLLVERERFPRHHIGESFVADVNRLLYDLGAYDKVARAGFVPKHGSTFVWGVDRSPWSVQFQDLEAIPGYLPRRGYQTAYTWHVRRDVYDALLLDHARDLGAEVLIGTSAEISFDASNSAELVSLGDRQLRPRFVIDATGQRSQVARRMNTLKFDPELQNVAVYAYYEGARLDPALSGTWECSRIAIVSIDEGWIWYIPLATGLVSVGVVTSRDVFLRRGQASVADFLETSLRSCPELAPLLQGATRVRYPGATADVLVLKDYCYSVERLHGPGWALCGDAAGFVDPILSIGCYLAHAAASHLAYTICSLLSGDLGDEALCFRAYEEQVQFSLNAFRRMTYMFYGFNDSKESWWWEAKRILSERALPASVPSKSAFLALATGYGINRPVYQEAISDFGVNIFSDFYRHLVSAEGMQSPTEDSILDGVYHRQLEFRAEPWVVPVEGTGRMREISRVTFSRREGDDGEVPSRLLVPSEYWRFLERLDGATPAESLAHMTVDESASLRLRLKPFLRGLVDMGVLAVDSAARRGG